MVRRDCSQHMHVSLRVDSSNVDSCILISANLEFAQDFCWASEVPCRPSFEWFAQFEIGKNVQFLLLDMCTVPCSPRQGRRLPLELLLPQLARSEGC
jgi:hypothetical protein